MTLRGSVVIPAHDEGAVIDRLLDVLSGDVRSALLEVVVVANGCRDDTASRARQHNGVTVVEIETASKIAALEAGDATAVAFPRVYLDADVSIDVDTLLALCDALLGDGVDVASPRLIVDTSRASWAVRQHYRVWELTDYRLRGHIGSGVYALSQDGRARFGHWPDVIADDRFVQQLFSPDERLTLEDHAFTVRSARSIRAHLRRSVRIARGNRELAAELHTAPPARAAGRGSLLLRVGARPWLWPAFLVYCVTWTAPNIIAARTMARGDRQAWNRDETSRVTA
ncbi:glycosyltransferase [Microbacterium sp. bgisy203]|uniref:glycosyltransferase n=1 Tax=Microbacterium sp. bgisy203 TaxID=3413799 RepID=UPI003D732B65